MHSTRVLKRINTLANSRSHLVGPELAQGAVIESIYSDGRCTHVVCSADAVRTILNDDESFGPSPIATTIEHIGRHTSVDMSPLQDVLRDNPMQTDRPRHAERRRAFAAAYARELRDGTTRFRACVRTHFDALVVNAPMQLTKDVVAPAVDAMLESIVVRQGVSPHRFARVVGGSAVLEYLKHPRKLAKKSAEVSAFLDCLPPGSDGQEPLRRSILLSYALQGRDPIVGGISAFMHHWLATHEDARSGLLESLSAPDLYARSAPVNYIVRTARQDAGIDGHAVREGEQVLLMLPWANSDAMARGERTMAFGSGAHACAGQALALALTDAFLDGLRKTHTRIDWSAVVAESPVAGVFRQYGNPA